MTPALAATALHLLLVAAAVLHILADRARCREARAEGAGC